MKLVKCEFRNSPWKNIVFRTICYLWLKAMQCAVDSHQTNRWGWFLLSLWAWQSVQLSRSVMSDFLQPHGRTTAHQASLSITNSQGLLKLMSIESVMPSNNLILCRSLLFPPSTFPRSGSFHMSEFFTSGGQSIRISASTSVLPMYIQGWFRLEWTGWISLQSKGLSRVFSNTTVQKHQFFGAQLSL